MTDSLSIYKGDTAGPWNVGVPLDDGTLATITAPWTCKIKVAGTAIDRAVADRTVDNKRFIAALTPAETDTLEVGQYVVAIEVENTTTIPPMRREQHIILTVAKHVVGSTDMPTPDGTIERLTTEIAEAKAQRRLVALGKAAVDVWRDGRRVRTPVQSLDQLNAYIRTLEGELLEAQKEAGIAMTTSRRSAIGTYYG
jgi:hypothetical protein